MQLVMNLLINALAVFLSSKILPGVHVDSFITAIVVAIVMGIINIFIKPIILILTLPITILTLGLFAFVINALLILLVTYFVPGFKVDGFLWALLFSLIVSIISSILGSLTK